MRELYIREGQQVTFADGRLCLGQVIIVEGLKRAPSKAESEKHIAAFRMKVARGQVALQ